MNGQYDLNDTVLPRFVIVRASVSFSFQNLALAFDMFRSAALALLVAASVVLGSPALDSFVRPVNR